MQKKKRKPQDKAKRMQRLQERLKYQLALVSSMPDEVMIDVHLVSALRGRSVASTWRDVKAGLIEQPIKICNSTRFRLGGVRRAT